ncbi:MAG: HU family DNA-binding protein [Actinomycetota bacterium]|nr:HU family DNA-binding protein [Actinomycetota bacterium]MDD5601007.1 HU family DNA-binding protein [Actinomycetota bacterium]
MNKAELVDAVSSETNLSKKDVTSVIDSLLDTISKTLAKGDKVSLVGFGTFQVSKRKARTGLNPRTGEEIKIPARTVPKFVAGKALKDKVK